VRSCQDAFALALWGQRRGAAGAARGEKAAVYGGAESPPTAPWGPGRAAGPTHRLISQDPRLNGGFNKAGACVNHAGLTVSSRACLVVAAAAAEGHRQDHAGV
jgi:hypothetical protein